MFPDLYGDELAKLMSGEKDPLTMFFDSEVNRDILKSVYSTGPVYFVTSQLLTSFLETVLTTSSPVTGGEFRILEARAGTGSTTRWVVGRLMQRGIPVEYTFTDISSSQVSAATRRFAI